MKRRGDSWSDCIYDVPQLCASDAKRLYRAMCIFVAILPIPPAYRRIGTGKGVGRALAPKSWALYKVH